MIISPPAIRDASAGVATPGAVLSTGRQAFDLDYSLIVTRVGCSDSDSEVHAVLLDKVVAQHATVAPSAEIETAPRHAQGH
jgi:nicotinamidase-related amidase